MPTSRPSSAGRRLVPLLLSLCSACGGGGGGDPVPASGGGTPAVNPPPSPPPTPPPTPPPNRGPTVANPNPALFVTVNRPFAYDTLQGGSTFTDPDGDPLTYDLHVNWDREPQALAIDGTRLSGVPTAVGRAIVSVTARDPGGLALSNTFELLIVRNAAPAGVVEDHLTTPGAFVDVDVSRMFSDPEGDPIAYTISLPLAKHGLVVNGTHVSGVLAAPASVFVEVTATDHEGASSSQVFSIAAAVPASSTPALPVERYRYADFELALPEVFDPRLLNGPTLWDTSTTFGRDNPITSAGATLGRVLFYDTRLSITNTMSCGSCHEQERGFTVPVRFATGVAGLPTNRNPMALANVRFNFGNRFFSDRRVHGLETMVLLPIQDPLELDNSLETVLKRLGETDFYHQLFADAFGTADITSDRIAKALAQFLRSMINYRSRFDEAMHPPVFTRWPDATLVFNAQELRGAQLFESAKCAICHQPNTHNQERPSNNGLDVIPLDVGSGNGIFRAASLRNIVLTAPYMHDGRFGTLREVIDHYDHGVQDSEFLDAFLRQDFPVPTQPVQRLQLSENDKQALEAFLGTLTDEAFLHDPKFSDPFR